MGLVRAFFSYWLFPARRTCNTTCTYKHLGAGPLFLWQEATKQTKMRMSCCVNQSGQQPTQDWKPLYTLIALIITFGKPEYRNVIFPFAFLKTVHFVFYFLWQRLPLFCCLLHLSELFNHTSYSLANLLQFALMLFVSFRTLIIFLLWVLEVSVRLFFRISDFSCVQEFGPVCLVV